MTVRVYMHAREEQSVETALIDCRAMENLMKMSYVRKLKLPIKKMLEPQWVYNVDGTQNKDGPVQYYTDLNVQTGQDYILFRFFLANMGSSKVLLGYPWMSTIQPRIN